ncbi:DUF5672 family protein [Hymenobacter coccineus]|uniref:DUF5672 domain-containing protein n=1 Tax=Hymenobacter coccineus TaxID=1908235 RepID=A0A1G1TI14_9BACT|nr:DUF5672 family protein [Hymenobacter coccineus]OGX90520.1 hypothetical protein BEN49_22450 [Hymenobacter coccineus]
MDKKLVTVVIPIHLEEPLALEKISLAQTLAVLNQYPITFMTPTWLDVSWYEEFCQGKATVHFERFDWRGHEAHGELLTNSVFYERFLPYEYILTVHLDAFVFRDELTRWCHAGYDYAGAVTYNPLWEQPNSTMRRLTGFSYPEYFGSGGFSLKKVSTFYRITSQFRFYMNAYHWLRRRRGLSFYDDLFLAQHFPKLSAGFRVPPKALAQQFGAAWEFGEEKDLPFSNHDNASLPFGIHGWVKYFHEYWKPAIRYYGHSI